MDETLKRIRELVHRYEGEDDHEQASTADELIELWVELDKWMTAGNPSPWVTDQYTIEEGPERPGRFYIMRNGKRVAWSDDRAAAETYIADKGKV